MDNPNTCSIKCNFAEFNTLKSLCEQHQINMKCLFYSQTCPHCKPALVKWNADSLLNTDELHVHTDDTTLMSRWSISIVPTIKNITEAAVKSRAPRGMSMSSHQPESGSSSGESNGESDTEERDSPCDYRVIRPRYVGYANLERSSPSERFNMPLEEIKNDLHVTCFFKDENEYIKHKRGINLATILSHASGWRWGIAKSRANAIMKWSGGECEFGIHQYLEDTEKMLGWLQCDEQNSKALSTLVCKDDLTGAISECSKSNPVVVLYYADWCGACTEFKKHWNEAVISCFDVDATCWISCNEKDERLRSHQAMQSIQKYPTVRLHSNGKVVDMPDRFFGSAEKLIEFSKLHTSHSL